MSAHEDATESPERRALQKSEIVDCILNFVDYPSLLVSRQLSTIFHIQASKKLFQLHFLSIPLQLENDSTFDDDDSMDSMNSYTSPENIVSKSHFHNFIIFTSSLTANSSRIQILNLKLDIRFFPRPFPLESLASVCVPFSSQVTHLYILCQEPSFDLDTIIQLMQIFPLLDSLHLSFSHNSVENHSDVFLSVFSQLKKLQLSGINFETLQAFLQLGNGTPAYIKELAILDSLYIQPSFLELYLTAKSQFGFDWFIPTIEINFQLYDSLSQLWEFLESLSYKVRELCLNLAYLGSGHDDPTSHNFQNYLPPATLDSLETLEIINLCSVSFFTRHFVSSLNLSSLREFYLNGVKFPLRNNLPRKGMTDLVSKTQETQWKALKMDTENLRTLLQIGCGLQGHAQSRKYALPLFLTIRLIFTESERTTTEAAVEAQRALIRAMLVQGQLDEGLREYVCNLDFIKESSWDGARNWSFPPFSPFTLKGLTALKNGGTQGYCREYWDEGVILPDSLEWQEMAEEIFGEPSKGEDGEEGPSFLRLANLYVTVVRSKVSSVVKKIVDRLTKGERNEEDILTVFENVFELSVETVKGTPAFLGRGSGSSGDTGLPPTMVFYCGRWMEECRCGKCKNGVCGPKNGCPCGDCLELVGMKVNQDGVVCK